jgi:hypothetical protein
LFRVKGFGKGLINVGVYVTLDLKILQFLLILQTKLMEHHWKDFGEHGRLTEWLGSGLQNRLRRFESATDLNKIPEHLVPGIFCFNTKLVYRTEGLKQKRAALQEIA